MAEPYLEIHPEDAARLGLRDAEICELSNALGRARLRVLISDRVAPGQPFAPMHWTAETASEGRVNTLVEGRTDPFSGQPASKASLVSVRRFDVAWYGFAASLAPMAPSRPYAAVARARAGWRAEVAGCKPPRDWIAEARAVLNLQGGDAVVVADPQAGGARIAFRDGPKLTGLLFAASTPVAVARDYVIGLLGTETPVAEALAGTPPANLPDPGATVCSCLGVGANTLRRAVLDGARSVETLGACTGAGTSCGSCRPELQSLIDAMPRPALVAE